MKTLKTALLAVGLILAPLAAAQSVPYPTYQVGPQSNGTFVVSDGTIITPSGTQVNLSCGPSVNGAAPVCAPVRAKAVAVNPNGNHTAAALVMGTHGATGRAVEIFNTTTGAVLQIYEPFGDGDGAAGGIAYTPDGLHLLFSQDGNYGPASFVTIANVSPAGLLSDNTQVLVPLDVNAEGQLTNVTCFPNSPGGTSGSFLIPCGFPVSIFSDDTFTSYPTSIAITADGKTAYVVLDNNDTLTKIDLTGLNGNPGTAPVQGAEVRVGNVPHSVVISPDGKTAYVSNEAGRIATANDFQEYSNGTPVVAEYPTGSVAPGTISVVDLATFTVTESIPVGHHPTEMAFWGKFLLVSNTYDDTISVIDPKFNCVVGTINVGLPISVPGEWKSAYGAGPNSIAVDATRHIAYVALYNANAIAVVDLNNWVGFPVVGLIPVGYAPASVALDAADGALIVANDKGWGTTGNPNPFYTVSGAPITDNFTGTTHGVTGLNTHQDLGTVSIVPIPSFPALWASTRQVWQNNHWDLFENIFSASGGNRFAPPRAIPNRIGDPSKIKHVFVIIRENRTYDQMLGDVVGGNGDPSLAVFGDNSSFAAYSVVTPNAHALVQRFPLLDNFYDPSRQSADGHNWITQAMAPYSDDIQSPDWLRDYPSNGGDAIAYQNKGHLWDTAAAAGVRVKNYGEYIEYNTFTGQGCTPDNYTQANYYNGPGYAALLPFPVSDTSKCEPSWNQFYNDTLLYEAGLEPQLQYYNLIGSVTPLPNLAKITVPNYPQFDLGIPDQYRVDVWKQDFANDLANDSVPQLEFLWIMSDHTTGPPNPIAEQADNDLGVGRVIDIISHSPIWRSSAIFIEEDDAQDGVDHVDGHRSPGYIISPFVKQNVDPNTGNGTGVLEDGTFYTQVNMTRTIEQILGITPMNQNDLVASPMKTLFVDNPPAANFTPWTHLPTQVPLCYGVANYVPPVNYPPSFNTCNDPSASAAALHDSPAVKALRASWTKMKTEVFTAKYHTPDSLDPDTVSHYDWYEATGYKVPFPGEKKVRPASDFNKKATVTLDTDD